MTKQEFDQVANRSGLSKADAGKAVDAFLDSIEAVLKGRAGELHRIRQVLDVGPRGVGVNPRTGEKAQIAATTVPKFSAGSKLKATVKAGRRRLLAPAHREVEGRLRPPLSRSG